MSLDREFYVTLAREAEIIYEEKRSEFIATARHVKNEQEAAEFITRVSEKYKDATHNVYAYYLAGGAHAKYSDDGERSGGEDIAVVVTRYFGGIKLGAGGLVRAYAEAAKQAIEAAEIVTYRLYTEFSLDCSYSEHRLFEARFTSLGAKIDDCEFGAGVTMKCAVPTAEYQKIVSAVSELSSGKLSPEIIGERFDFE